MADANSTQLWVRLVTPDRILIDRPADAVELPSKSGYMEVLLGHAPLLTELGSGEVHLHGVQGVQGGGEGAGASGLQRFHVSWGFAEVLPERVTILADAALKPEEIDPAAAKQELDEGHKMWDKAGDVEENYTRANEVIADAESKLATAVDKS